LWRYFREKKEKNSEKEDRFGHGCDLIKTKRPKYSMLIHFEGMKLIIIFQFSGEKEGEVEGPY